jgi:phage-related protein
MPSRASRTLLVVLAAAVGVLARALVVQNRKLRAAGAPTVADEWRTIRARRRALHTVALVVLGNWVGDAVSTLAGFFTDVGDAVWNAIWQVVDYAAGLLLGAINWVYSNLASAITSVIGALESAYTTLADLVGTAVNGLLSVINDVKGWVSGLVDGLANIISTAVAALWDGINTVLSTAIDFGKQVLAQAITWANALFDQLWALVQSWVGGLVAALWAGVTWVTQHLADVAAALWDRVWALVQNVGGELWHGLDVLRGWAATAISDAFSGLHDLFFAALDALKHDILGPLGDLLRWVEDHAVIAVQVVEDVIGWLVWLARFPFDTARELWHDVQTFTLRRILERLASTVPDRAPAMLEHLVRDRVG